MLNTIVKKKTVNITTVCYYLEHAYIDCLKKYPPNLKKYPTKQYLDTLSSELKTGQFQISTDNIQTSKIVERALVLALQNVSKSIKLPIVCKSKQSVFSHMTNSSFKGSRWVIQPDMTNFFSKVPLAIITESIQTHIKCIYTIKLIGLFLKQNVKNDYVNFISVINGPSDSICYYLYPILLDIYLYPLDLFLSDLQTKTKQISSFARSVNPWLLELKAELKQMSTANLSSEAIQKQKRLKYMIENIDRVNLDDSRFKRLDPIRYKASIIIGFTSIKLDVLLMQAAIVEFFQNKLGLLVKLEDFSIVDLNIKPIEFLDVILRLDYITEYGYSSSSKKKLPRSATKQVCLFAPVGELLVKNLIAAKFLSKYGKPIACDNFQFFCDNYQFFNKVYTQKNILIRLIIKIFEDIVTSILYYYTRNIHNYKQLCKLCYKLHCSCLLTISKILKLSIKEVIEEFGGYLKFPSLFPVDVEIDIDRSLHEMFKNR